MTAEIPKAPRTHAGVVAMLNDLPIVREAWLDSSEPYTTIRVTVTGVGAPPLLQREFMLAGLSITNIDEDSDETTEITARRVFRHSNADAAVATNGEETVDWYRPGSCP